MSKFIYSNPNPYGIQTNDCTIRGLSLFFNEPWRKIYWDVVTIGSELGRMPETNYVWMEYLKRRGYKEYPILDTCPNCYTIIDFCNDHHKGTYLLGTGKHVVTVIDGNYYDVWDSGDEVPIFFFRKEI